jgi:hypothetical protein
MSARKSNGLRVLGQVIDAERFSDFLKVAKYPEPAWEVSKTFTLFFGDAVSHELFDAVRVIEHYQCAVLRVRELAGGVHDILQDRGQVQGPGDPGGHIGEELKLVGEGAPLAAA